MISEYILPARRVRGRENGGARSGQREKIVGSEKYRYQTYLVSKYLKSKTGRLGQRSKGSKRVLQLGGAAGVLPGVASNTMLQEKKFFNNRGKGRITVTLEWV